MRKILAVLLCLSFIMPSAFAIDNDGMYADFLSSLGVIEKQADNNLNTAITRAEFIVNVIRMLKYDIPDSANEPTFTDVPLNYWAHDQIALAWHLGFISGNGDGTFLPDEPIFIPAAVKILVCALGYGPTMQSDLLDSSWQIGNQIGLLKNVEADFSLPVTRGELFIMMYNALHAKMFVISGYGSDNSFTAENNETFLSVLYKTDYVKGIVEATEYASLHGEALLKSRQVKINGVIYNTVGIDTSDLVGKNVKCYYNNNNKEEVAPFDSLYIREESNETVVINADDFTEYSNGRIYGNKETKVRSYSIDTKASFLYNNRLLRDKEIEERIKPTAGWIELCDNNRDGIYDVVKIKDYKTFRLDVYDNISNTLSGKDGTVIQLDKYPSYKILNEKKISVSSSVLPIGCIVTFYDPLDQNFPVFIEFSTQTQDIEVEEIDREEKYIIDSNNKKIKISSNAVAFFDNLEIGETYLMFFDSFGQAFEKSLNNSVYKPYYLMNAGYSSSVLSGLKIKAVDSKGEKHIYNCQNKVNVRKSNGAEGLMTNVELYALLCGADNLVDRQAVMLMLNDESKVSGIMLAAEETYTNLPFRKLGLGEMNATEKTSRFRYDSATKSFMNRILLRGDTTVFSVPFAEDNNVKDEYFQSVKSTYFSNMYYNITSEYRPIPITIEPDGLTTDVLVWEENYNMLRTMSDYSYGMLLTNISDITEDGTGRILKKLTLYSMAGKEETFLYDPDAAGGLKDRNGRVINRGDIIRLQLGKEGFATAELTETFFDFNNNQLLKETALSYFRYNSSFRLTPATVLKKEGTVALCAVRGEFGAVNEILNFANTKIVTFDKQKKPLLIGTKSYKVGDAFMLILSSGTPRLIIYYQ